MVPFGPSAKTSALLGPIQLGRTRLQRRSPKPHTLDFLFPEIHPRFSDWGMNTNPSVDPLPVLTNIQDSLILPYEIFKGARYGFSVPVLYPPGRLVGPCNSARGNNGAQYNDKYSFPGVKEYEAGSFGERESLRKVRQVTGESESRFLEFCRSFTRQGTHEDASHRHTAVNDIMTFLSCSAIHHYACEGNQQTILANVIQDQIRKVSIRPQAT